MACIQIWRHSTRNSRSLSALISFSIPFLPTQISTEYTSNLLHKPISTLEMGYQFPLPECIPNFLGDFLEARSPNLVCQGGAKPPLSPLPSQVLHQASAFAIFMLIMPPKSQVHNSGCPKGVLTLLHSMVTQFNNLTEQDSAKVSWVSRLFLFVLCLTWLGGMQHPLPQHFPFFTKTHWKKIWP